MRMRIIVVRHNDLLRFILFVRQAFYHCIGIEPSWWCLTSMNIRVALCFYSLPLMKIFVHIFRGTPQNSSN